MDGLLNLYKPTGITSAKALYRVRRILGQRKSGHAGTLDPAAEGVLLVLLGKATKLTEALMDQPKEYLAAARLDVTSASYDSDEPLAPVAVAAPPPREAVEHALARFVGRISQAPPALSAIKIGGRPAYKLARKGAPPELKPRDVIVHGLRLLDYRWPNLQFDMQCGRGTYVRAVIRDLGAALGTGGCLTALQRSAIGPFRVDQAWSFERLEAATDPWSAVLPLEAARALLGTPLPPDGRSAPRP